MNNRGARIDALSRYISLLQQEEIRLTWVSRSAAASEQNREDAKASKRKNADKIANAELELRRLLNEH